MQAFEVTGTIDPTEYVAQRAIEQTEAKAIDRMKQQIKSLAIETEAKGDTAYG